MRETTVQETAMISPLVNLPLRARGRLVRLAGPRSFRRRLMELGLIPGTELQVLRVAPLGDPLQLLVRGCRLSIRRAEAAHVLVEAEGEGSTA